MCVQVIGTTYINDLLILYLWNEMPRLSCIPQFIRARFKLEVKCGVQGKVHILDHHLRMLAKIMAEDSDPKLLFSGTIYFISDYSSVGR